MLAGGRGRRMGGVEKGLLDWHGAPLAGHAMRRLAPQVDNVAVSANRDLPRYAAFADAVWPDDTPAGIDPDAGSLLGLLTALRRAATPWVATVPCDAPGFPVDLVERLAAALTDRTLGLATAATVHGQVWRPEPAFLLAPRALADDLHAFLAAGGRKVADWCARHPCGLARFADGAAFRNLNTPDEFAAAHALSQA